MWLPIALMHGTNRAEYFKSLPVFQAGKTAGKLTTFSARQPA
jgi:hypothetical protein